jgi:hypothetical protein
MRERRGQSVSADHTQTGNRASVLSRCNSGLLLISLLLLLSGCVSGPQMPVEPVRCFDSDGHEIPCVDEMDCHEEGSVKEQA